MNMVHWSNVVSFPATIGAHMCVFVKNEPIKDLNEIAVDVMMMASICFYMQMSFQS